jgi:xanthine dehydrogenase accessory factor
LLPRLGFRVLITDTRESAVDPARFAGLSGVAVHHGSPDAVADKIPVRAPVVAATHEHDLDEAAIVWAVERGHAYVGGIGSKGKAHKIRKALTDRGLPAERIEAVRMPVGIALGGRTPDEIAVSIAAELIAWRAGKQL